MIQCRPKLNVFPFFFMGYNIMFSFLLLVYTSQKEWLYQKIRRYDADGEYVNKIHKYYPISIYNWETFSRSLTDSDSWIKHTPMSQVFFLPMRRSLDIDRHAFLCGWVPISLTKSQINPSLNSLYSSLFFFTYINESPNNYILYCVFV